MHKQCDKPSLRKCLGVYINDINLRSCTHYLNRYGSIRYRIFKCDNQHNLYSCINYPSCCGIQEKLHGYPFKRTCNYSLHLCKALLY